METVIVAQARDTEQVPVVECKTKMRSFASRAFTGALLAIFSYLVAISPAGAATQDETFEQSGIHFPGGFDLNTVGELNGKIKDVHRSSGNGPVIVNLETMWEKYAIITCPSWYWDELKIKVSVGAEVLVIGSKSLGKDSNLYIIAQEMHFVEQGRIIMLRSKAGTPIWDEHHGKTDSQRGSGNRARGQKERSK